jgi:hypothetical protein
MNLKMRLNKLEGAIKPLSLEPKEDPSLIFFRKYSKAISCILCESCYVNEAGLNGKPWFPKDPEKYFWAKSEVEKYRSEGGTIFENFQWPTLGEIPVIEMEELTEERKEEIKKKIRDWRKPGSSGIDGIMANLAVSVYADRVSGLNWR